MNSSQGKLFLIPSLLAENAQQTILPTTLDVVDNIDFFIVENAKSARRFLRSIGFKKAFDDIPMHELNEHHNTFDQQLFLETILKGKNIALISDAGIPAVADPGNIVVLFAHNHDIEICPLVGPSSIMLALMSSGLNGQQFYFHGYIPLKEPQRSRYIKLMDIEASKGLTQIFIETPYRNNKLLQELIAQCNGSTLLCVACDLTAPTQFIKTKTMNEWKQNAIDFNKRPAVFLLGS